MKDKITAAGDVTASNQSYSIAIKNGAPGTFFSVVGCFVICFTIIKGYSLDKKSSEESAKTPAITTLDKNVDSTLHMWHDVLNKALVDNQRFCNAIANKVNGLQCDMAKIKAYQTKNRITDVGVNEKKDSVSGKSVAVDQAEKQSNVRIGAVISPYQLGTFRPTQNNTGQDYLKKLEESQTRYIVKPPAGTSQSTIFDQMVKDLIHH